MFFYSFIPLLENKTMELDWGAVIAAIVALGGIIGLYVKMQVSLKEIEIRQQNQDARIDTLKDMIEKQIQVDNGIKEALQDLKIAITRLETKIGE